jgi:hypothetical protein
VTVLTADCAQAPSRNSTARIDIVEDAGDDPQLSCCKERSTPGPEDPLERKLWLPAMSS